MSRIVIINCNLLTKKIFCLEDFLEDGRAYNKMDPVTNSPITPIVTDRMGHPGGAGHFFAIRKKCHSNQSIWAVTKTLVTCCIYWIIGIMTRHEIRIPSSTNQYFMVHVSQRFARWRCGPFVCLLRRFFSGGPYAWQKTYTIWAMKNGPLVVSGIQGIILPSYMGIIIYHPY